MVRNITLAGMCLFGGLLAACQAPAKAPVNTLEPKREVMLDTVSNTSPKAPAKTKDCPGGKCNLCDCPSDGRCESGACDVKASSDCKSCGSGGAGVSSGPARGVAKRVLTAPVRLPVRVFRRLRGC